ncbi:hydrogenase expression/formation protein [Rhodoblastus acidophilus]|uniref:Hydrogenase expression/formation protein n=1 Tax=Candidatus Rhodoblastus alkanivorans TaxID=2954117 RepID=A0ABS9Z2F1_9HYPH|nr:hydrogenase expression/formation protein [Candidatus Rhodoblastus alkanivorans]MCI4677449.1 hydrogenase expression/formation protein [Candidatus Rhodoblastus alkanivorans]MCI4681808.1 hydrogenase expression/formation protein [Candidatus Rhodoblastus alkanivorans]MDI4642858.1 hydrogenase expression/formation protein [Rhodoblastus acidophilus]
MKAGFWVAPEGGEQAMSVMPIGGEPLDETPAGRKISLLATGKAEDLIAACPRVRQLLPDIVAALETQAENAPGRLFDLTEFSSDEILLVEQVTGEGEVAGVVSLPDGIGAQIHESVMAGLWRVRFTDAGGKLVADYLEVSSLPEIARRAALNNCQPLTSGEPPAGAMNVMPLLTEIASRSAAHKPGDAAHTITFSLLPMSPDDMSHLQRRLGPGAVRLVSKGYGSCRILSTATRNVWSVQFFNAMDEIILDTLEIGDAPAAACAAQEDFRESARRLREIEEAYFA